MPIYEYKCKKCGNVFETIFYSLQEKRQVPCPACQSPKTARLMSTFGRKARSTAGGTAGAGRSACTTTSCPPS